jgi:hypothetical protein
MSLVAGVRCSFRGKDAGSPRAECKRERGTQFAPEAGDALDRLWALGALTTADVSTVAFD